MSLPIPGLDDLLALYDRLFNRLVVELEACGPCHAPEFLTSIRPELDTDVLLRLREEVRRFLGDLEDAPSAAQLTRALEVWTSEHAVRQRARSYLMRLRRTLDFMDDATSLEKARFLQMLLPRNQAIYRPITQALAAAATRSSFVAQPGEAPDAARAIASVKPDLRDDFYTYSIHVMDRPRGTLSTDSEEKSARVELAASVIAHFRLDPLKSLLSLALDVIQEKMHVHEELVPLVKSAVDRKRPLIVRFRVLLPPNTSAPAFQAERHLYVRENGTGARFGNGPAAAGRRIELQPVRNVEDGKEVRFAQQGDYYCLSTRPVQEIKDDWDQAQLASVQLRLRSSTTGLIREKWLTSAVKPTRAILPS